MGASTSTDHKASIEQREAESIATSSGALPFLQKSFSLLADPHSNAIPFESLKKCFSLTYKNPISEAPFMPDAFLGLLDHFGSSMADLFFAAENGGVSWVEFVKGYNKSCGRMSSSASLNTLLRLFAATAKKSGLSLNLELESGDDSDSKISGFLLPTDVLFLLWLCWTALWDVESGKFLKNKVNLCLPDVNHLVLSAVTSCGEGGGGVNVWDCNVISGLEIQIPVGKFLTWVLQTLPRLPDCCAQFFHSRIQSCTFASEEGDSESSCPAEGDVSSANVGSPNLLTRGNAWAISLAMRNTTSEELSRVCFSSNTDGTDENLIYRSSLHGRGLNRFRSNVEGYQGSLLMLISATSQVSHERSTSERKWIIGALTHQGFENMDVFYGSSGNLYAICPVFHAYSPTGKEKNFVYSHLHPTGRYEAHPKPVGIGFGGTVGNKRVFIDEDFAKLTVHHHAVDKTYQHGYLFPDQGFLPVEALILEVEVWGLGGRGAKGVQDKYKKREELFTQQRRKVDLKTFANWDDSPEKMMMDMMSDPNAVRREDR